MNIQQAIERLQEGSKIRRAEFPEDEMIMLEEIEGKTKFVKHFVECFMFKGKSVYRLSYQDAIADDWEIIE